MTRRYKAFISYSWADREWGEWLHRSLETYRAPKGVADGQSLHPIFKDREEEAAGVSVGAAIEAALGASEFLIVICSPRSAQSMWVNREVAWFKTYKNKANILALIVDGEPGVAGVPGREAEECFPKTLTHKVGSDLQPTDDWEDAPLAADARALGDGKRGAKLKLAAALLGVGLDALVHRDERRRTIRRRFVTGASLALAAVLGGLSIFAFTQRDAAILARNDAVKARDDAEGIIELILTDLKSDLEGFGTLKSVTAIGNRAVGYYEGQDVKALTPDQLGRRARVLLMLGEADNKRGDLTAALARYETAAATTKEQLTRDPENPQRMYDHAQSVFWVGYIAWQRGDRATAKRQFTEYHDLAQRLVTKDPANEDWQAEVEYAYSNLGTLAMDDGDAAAAEEWFRKSLEIALARLAKMPDDTESVWGAGQAYAWLADTKSAALNFSASAALRRLEIELYSNYQHRHGANRRFQATDATARTKLAELAVLTGSPSEAIQLAFEAVELQAMALSESPEDADQLRRASSVYTVYGETLLAAGKLDEAKMAIRQSVNLALASAETSEADSWDKLLLARTHIALGRIAEAEDDVIEAVRLANTVLVSMKKIEKTGADALEVRRHVCNALAIKARVGANGKTHWAEVSQSLRALGERLNPSMRILLAEAFVNLGEIEKAQAIAERLSSAGLQHPDFLNLLSLL